MKKILIYINSMKPAGGIERVVANLSNKLVNEYDITILTKDMESSFYDLDSRINFESLNNPLTLNMNSRISRIVKIVINTFRTIFKLKKYLNTVNADYIYTTNPVNSFEVLTCRNRAKLVISEHGSIFGYNKIYQELKKYIYPKAYRIAVPTTLDTELYKIEGYNSVYIPHLTTFNGTNLSEEKERIVLNVGRLTKDKQQYQLLNIWNRVLEENELKNWKLIIIGTGEEKNRLIDYIEKNALWGNVELIDPVQNIEDYFSKSSIFAFTSRFEGFGMVLLEAMSFGIPCISYNCPSGPRDIIANEINGFLIEPNFEDEYVEKLKLLMKSSSIRKKMGVKAVEEVQNWNNEKIMELWRAIFK